MRLHQTISIVALIALFLLPIHLNGEETVPLSRFNAKQLEKLKSGDPVCMITETVEEDDNSSGHGQCSIIISKPIDQCFEIMVKIDLQVHFVPNKVKSDIVSRDGDKLLIDNEYRFYGVATRYHSIYTIYEKRHLLDWEIDKSRPHDLEDNSGFYQFEKIDEKNTLLTYGATKFDVGFSVPGFIKNFLLGRSIPAMAINIKKYIESNREWRQ